MNHLEKIESYLNTLHTSEKIHALVIKSPPGWGKSTVVEKALTRRGDRFQVAGAYTTPLGFYNALCTHPTDTHVLDDCAGVFTEPTALSLLKAATWGSVGTGGSRHIAWTSTSGKALVPSFDFTGKLVLLTNYIPASTDVQAFLSRSLPYEIKLDKELITKNLRNAAQSEKYFDDLGVAGAVAEYIIMNLDRLDWSKLSYRSLQIAYEVAKTNPEIWKELVDSILPSVSVRDLVMQLTLSEMSTKEQVAEFQRITGLSRRTFFNYREALPEGDQGETEVTG